MAKDIVKEIRRATRHPEHLNRELFAARFRCPRAHRNLAALLQHRTPPHQPGLPHAPAILRAEPMRLCLCLARSHSD